MISDMARPSSKQAGYELLKLVRDSGNSVPFIIYAGSNLSQYRLEAENRGAQGTPASRQEATFAPQRFNDADTPLSVF